MSAGTTVRRLLTCSAVCVGLWLLAAVFSVVLVPTQAQQPGVPLRMEIDYVRVDVTVTDQQGRHIRNLTADDFQLYEDGKEQVLSAVAFVEIPVVRRRADAATGGTDLVPDVRSNAADAAGRVYVILLDDLHVHPMRSSRAKEVAREFIEKYFGRHDLASVLHTSGRSDASQEFTSDPQLLLEAIDKFAGRKMRSSVLERLADAGGQRDERSRADTRMNRVVDPLEAQRADQSRRMLKTLTALGDLLAEAPERRKALLLISEGIDYPLQQGIGQTVSGVTAFTSTHAPDMLTELRQAVGAAARANLSVYSIDPRGLAGTGDDLIEVASFPENPLLGLSPKTFQDELHQQQDTLRIISEQTGGVASLNSNDFSGAFDRIVSDNSAYYLLGYYSTDPRRDGRYRSLEVKVKRPNVRVRARRGYIAAPPPRKQAAGLLTAEAEPSSELRDALNSPLPVTRLPMRVFAAPFRGAKHASVAVGLELDARNFRFEQGSGRFSNRLHVAVIAVDEQMKLRAGDRQTVDLSLKPETYAAVQARGLRVMFRLNLPAGRYQLRAAAHEAGSGAAGSVFYDLEVPAFGQAPLALSGLVLTAGSAAEIPTARPDAVLDGVLSTPPTGLRSFHAGETMRVLFEATGVGQPAVAALHLLTTVRGADGRVLFNHSEQVPDEELGRAAWRYADVVSVPLAQFPRGPYILRVEARGDAKAEPSNRSVFREVPFEVRRQ